MTEPSDDDAEIPRVLVGPGTGLLVRRATAVLYFPAPFARSSRPDRPPPVVTDALRRFRSTGVVSFDDASPPDYALVDWTNRLHVEATITVHLDETRTVRIGTPPPGSDDAVDLVDGVVRAGGCSIVLPTMVRPAFVDGRGSTSEVDPPQFDELRDLDVTLAPLGPITYPDDNTDRTSQQPFDVRCSNGHANARPTTTCRVCGEPIDTTARRATPRAVSALAALRLPDGRVIPIDQTLVVGRDPQAVAARVSEHPRLVRLDAPSTVSRTHLVVRVENRAVTVTDCGSRGRSALLTGGESTPTALTAWEPAEVSIGDQVQLGGPTSVTIVEPPTRDTAEPTERPSDDHARDEQP